MAIDFKEVLTKVDGIDNGVAAKMASLRNQSSSVTSVINQADDTIGDIRIDSLPSIPSVGALTAELNSIKSDLNTTANDVADLSNVVGSCLGGSIGSLKSIQKDAFGMIDDALGALDDLAGMSSELAILSDIFNKAKDMLSTLGIDSLMAAIYGSLGCMQDSSLISDVTSELTALQTELGLNAEGQQDPESYGTMIAEKFEGQGLPAEFKNNMTRSLNQMAEATKEMGDNTKAIMAESINTTKEGVTSLPTPPSYF